MEVVLPGVPDAGEHLRAALGDVDPGVAHPRLGHADDLAGVLPGSLHRSDGGGARRPCWPPSERLMSANWCFTAWKEPIGRPNAVRSTAYWRVSSKRASIAPTVSDVGQHAGQLQLAFDVRVARRRGLPSTDVGRDDRVDRRRPQAERCVMSSPWRGVTVMPGVGRRHDELRRGRLRPPAETRNQSAMCTGVDLSRLARTTRSPSPRVVAVTEAAGTAPRRRRRAPTWPTTSPRHREGRMRRLLLRANPRRPTPRRPRSWRRRGRVAAPAPALRR